MSLCKCEGSHRVHTIGNWDGCPLENKCHTSFVVQRCLDCGGISGFPSNNLDLALRDGTAATRKKLAEIINSSDGLPRCPTCGKPEDIEIDENGNIHLQRLDKPRPIDKYHPTGEDRDGSPDQ